MNARHASRFYVCILLAALLPGCVYVQTRSSQIVRVERAELERKEMGAMRFVFDDLGALNTETLNTNAFAWKPVVTAMAMEYAAQRGMPPSPALIPAIFRQYGWIMPQSIDNWPGAAAPSFDKPLGIVSGELKRSLPRIRLEVANIGCAACHAGVSYDARGEPTGRAWLGSPNTSRFFDGYTRAIVSALRYTRDKHDALMETIPKIFPQVSEEELHTIRRYVLPQITKRLSDVDANKEMLLLFDQGGAGLTNGIAALKLRLDAQPTLVSEHEHGYTSIPDLYGRRLRSSVLYDGLYALRADQRFVERRAGDFTAEDFKRLSSIVAFFVVPTMGIRADESGRVARRVGDILEFVLDYEPQPYPGNVDRGRALDGSRLYAANCASCHGRYSEGIDHPRLMSFPNRPVPQAEMATDPERWRAITDRMVRAIRETPVGTHLNAANAQGYVAPILNGLWASAPYLHNGSVPTVWHLMRPATRPVKFLVGGHKLDLAKMGIAGESDAEGVYRYPHGYKAWSAAVLFDSSGPGRGNAGHEKEFDVLSEEQKDALLEFLKLL